MTAPQIKTRPPTGRVPWPLILVEGEEKAGKTFTAARLTASDRVGDCYWLDLGEGAADEYGALPGTRYAILDHDGSYLAILRQIQAVHAAAGQAAEAGEKPVVLVVDTGTALWDGLKDAATYVARQRAARKRKVDLDSITADEVTVTSDLWNTANARWRAIMSLLLTMPGIVILTARGKQVAVIGSNGQPVEGQKEWRVEGQKNMAFDATAWIRMSREDGASLIGARSLRCGLRPGHDKPKRMPEEWEERGLEWFIFDALGCTPGESHVRDLRDFNPEGPAEEPPLTPERVRELAEAAWDSAVELRKVYDLARQAGGDELLRATVRAIDSDATVSLAELIVTRGRSLPDANPPAEKADTAAAG